MIVGRPTIENPKSQIPNPKSGYTLTELLIVITIMVMLMGISLPAVKQVIVEDLLGPEDAVQIIRDALELYRRLRRGELLRA